MAPFDPARTSLGIELGSTRIKACLVDADRPSRVLATGVHEWENEFVDRLWTYSLDAVWSGVRSAYSALAGEVRERHGVRLTTLGSIGVSAMMHGYLPLDADGELLVPFRTWRNTNTGRAAAELSDLLGVNIPLRWSVAHLRQAVLDEEPHVPQVAALTTLAGYVHRALTGEHVLGVGDASGMFPVDPARRDYDAAMLQRADRLLDGAVPPLRDLLPRVLVAGEQAGRLTEGGAALLDPGGTLRPGVPCCPPEGDAGTGMVATNAVAPRTGNVSVGTSIFAMVVLERPLRERHEELDLVTTPTGDAVAMVHCNNGASELAAWVAMFARFADATGAGTSTDEVYEVLLTEVLSAPADAGGVLAYNHLSGEPVVGLEEGRPLVLRAPGSDLTLGTFMRAQLYGVFATLALGMRVLDGEGVRVDRMYAHGGLFRTPVVAQRVLAGALDAPVAVASTASEGGAWGMAVLAAHLLRDDRRDLATWLRETVFAGAEDVAGPPDRAEVEAFRRWVELYETGLAVERTAVELL